MACPEIPTGRGRRQSQGASQPPGPVDNGVLCSDQEGEWFLVMRVAFIIPSLILGGAERSLVKTAITIREYKSSNLADDSAELS
jgi:hypothetical protein